MLDKLIEFMPEVFLFVVLPAITLLMLGYLGYILYLWLFKRDS